jgi:hypothetical protein
MLLRVRGKDAEAGQELVQPLEPRTLQGGARTVAEESTGTQHKPRRCEHPVVHYVGGHQCHYPHIASLLGWVLPACTAGPRSRGRERSRCGSNFSRAPPHAYSDTGFELAGRNYPLWLEIQPSGPLLQRITRSPRSRPSLHGSASKHVHSHRACTQTHVRARRQGCGT